MNLRNLHPLTLDDSMRIAGDAGLFDGAVRVGDKIDVPMGEARLLLSEAEALTFFRGAIPRHLRQTR